MTTNPGEPQPPERPAVPATIELGEQPGGVPPTDRPTDRPTRGRPASRATLITVGVVVLVVGFLGGILTHRAYAGTGSAGAGNQTAAGPSEGAGPNGYGPRRPGASGAPDGGDGFGGTAGTIDHVSGDTVYVKTSAGKIVKVTVGAGTTIEITKDGKVTDLAAGQTVVVQGQTGSDGSVTANRISEGNQGFGRRTRPTN